MKILLTALLLIPLVTVAAGPYVVTGVVHDVQIIIACDTDYASSNSITAWLPAKVRDFTVGTDPRQEEQTLFVGFFTNSIYDIHTETTNSASWVVTNTFTPVLYPIKDGTLSVSVEVGAPIKYIFLKGASSNTCYTLIGKGSM